MTRLLLLDAVRPAGLATTVVTLTALVLAALQALTRIPMVPSPGLLGHVLLGLLPAALSLALPVGLLFGFAAAARGWREGGELMALATMGQPQRRLLGPLFMMGTMAAFVQLGILHLAEPMGRQHSKSALLLATQELSLVPGEPMLFGDWLARATQRQGNTMEGVFVANGGVVVAAKQGTTTPGALVLHDGEAMLLEDDVAATLRFAKATIPVAAPAFRRDVAELSGPTLLARVDKMERRQADASFERLAWYKRTTIPANVALLALLAFPLGARGARPALTALSTLVGWWGAMRLCDHQVGPLGPELASTLPFMGLLIAVVFAWSPGIGVAMSIGRRPHESRSHS